MGLTRYRVLSQVGYLELDQQGWLRGSSTIAPDQATFFQDQYIGGRLYIQVHSGPWKG